MTTPDELEQAVEQMEADLALAENGENQWLTVSVCTDDLRLLLSERAELLVTVERMRGGLTDAAAALGKAAEIFEGYGHNITARVMNMEAQEARAALTTGEDK
jgi:hypothetical protein